MPRTLMTTTGGHCKGDRLERVARVKGMVRALCALVPTERRRLPIGSDCRERHGRNRSRGVVECGVCEPVSPACAEAPADTPMPPNMRSPAVLPPVEFLFYVDDGGTGHWMLIVNDQTGSTEAWMEAKTTYFRPAVGSSFLPPSVVKKAPETRSVPLPGRYPARPTRLPRRSSAVPPAPRTAPKVRPVVTPL